MKTIAGSLALAILSGGVALADIPVNDDQQLTQKTLTRTTTTSTVPVQQNNNKGQGGINCATHQGQKGTTQNNTAQPNTATGNTAVQQYGSSRILVGKKPRCDVAMSHNFQWLFGVFKGLKTGHDFGHEKTA